MPGSPVTLLPGALSSLPFKHVRPSGGRSTAGCDPAVRGSCLPSSLLFPPLKGRTMRLHGSHRPVSKNRLSFLTGTCMPLQNIPASVVEAQHHFLAAVLWPRSPLNCQVVTRDWRPSCCILIGSLSSSWEPDCFIFLLGLIRVKKRVCGWWAVRALQCHRLRY